MNANENLSAHQETVCDGFHGDRVIEITRNDGLSRAEGEPPSYKAYPLRHYVTSAGIRITSFCRLLLFLAMEFIRVNVRILGPFTLAHLVSLALVLTGSLILLREPAPSHGGTKARRLA
jgi:hypothetical protein